MTQIAAANPLADQPIDKIAVDTIRILAMDAVQAANSGHPGTPMALAPVLYTFWSITNALEVSATHTPRRL